MFLNATSDQVRRILGAMREILTASGAAPCTASDRATLTGAYRFLFEQPGELDIEALPRTQPRDLAAVVHQPGLATHAMRFLAVCAFIDGTLDPARIRAVLAFAQQLGVHESYIAELTAMAQDHLRWATADMSRRNIESLLNQPWTGDVEKWLLPYRGTAAEPALVQRYERLSTLQEGTFGKAFWTHFHDNGYPFPGDPNALNEAFTTRHDSTHVLSGYDTSFQGELLVSTFTAAMHKTEQMAGHILPVILSWHLGIQLNETARASTGWLDPEKFWVAWDRGSEAVEDVFAPQWSLWAVAEEPVSTLRRRYGIPLLDPAHAPSLS